MRILTVLKNMGPGGLQRTAEHFVRGYRQAGHTAAILCLLEKGSRGDRLVADGFEMFEGGSTESARRQSLTTAIEWTPDLIHIHRAGIADSVITPAIHFLRSHVADQVPLIETNAFGKVDYSSRADPVDLHLVPARWTLWKWQQWRRYYRNKSVGTVVPNPVDTTQFSPANPQQVRHFRRRHQIPEEAIVFGRAGQPNASKWSPIILDAFAQILDQHSESYLLLVGAPPDLEKRISALSPRTRNQIRTIDFIQNDDRLQHCYSSIDIFLHASAIGESFGLVLAEAMACETPVITLSTPAHDNSQLEVVGHERGGLAVTDTDHMVQAMDLLVRDSERRELLGRQGRQWTRSNYALDVVQTRLKKIVDLVANRSSRSELENKLKDEGLPTHIANAEISELLDLTMGQHTLTRKLLMRIIHIPWLHRLWWTFR